MARLFVLSGSSIGSTFELDATSVIGRGDDCDVVVPEASISRKHARLVPRDEPGVWKVVDLNSSNGVHVGGKRVANALVRDGDTFTLGDVEFRLRDEGADDEPELPEFVDEEPAVEVEEAPEILGDLTDELELEFTPGPPKAAPRAQKPAPPTRSEREPDRTGAKATAEREARRREAMGGAPRATGGSSVAATATGGAGRPVLQYSAPKRAGMDLAQLPGWVRTLIVVLGLAFAAGLGYGAFKMTQTARSQANALDGDAYGR